MIDDTFEVLEQGVMRTIKQVVERVDSWLVIVQLVEVLMMEEDMEMVAIINMEDNLVLSYFHCSDFIYIRICLEIVRQFDLMILLFSQLFSL